MSEDHGAGNGNQPGGEGGGQEEKVPEWAKQLTATSQGLAETMQNLLTFAQSQAQRRQQEETGNRAPAQVEEEDVEAALETMSEAQLEAMPRRQMLMSLMNEFNKNLTRHLAPLQEEVSRATNIAISGNVQSEIEKFAEKTKDFQEWGPEMQKIAGEHKGLHIRRIYAIARAENPQKAAEMDKKYKTDSKEEGEGKKPPKPPPARKSEAFGGMSPSSGGTGTPNRKMSVKDAATAAWEDTVAKLGNIFET